MARRASQRAHRAAERDRRRGRRSFWRRLRRYAVIFGLGSLGLIIILGLVLPGILPGPSRTFSRDASGPGTIVSNQGRTHLAPGELAQVGYYNTSPPTSGAHAPTWERCGTFEAPIADEIQPHNLEHGFVLIQYNTEDQALIDELNDVVQNLSSYPDFLIMAPYPPMEQTIALTAWNVIQYLDTVDEVAINAFAETYRGLGPEVGAPSC